MLDVLIRKGPTVTEMLERNVSHIHKQDDSPGRETMGVDRI